MPRIITLQGFPTTAWPLVVPTQPKPFRLLLVQVNLSINAAATNWGIKLRVMNGVTEMWHTLTANIGASHATLCTASFAPHYPPFRFWDEPFQVAPGAIAFAVTGSLPAEVVFNAKDRIELSFFDPLAVGVNVDCVNGRLLVHDLEE